MGLLSKLLKLRDYRINLLVDDSGSMSSATDVTFKEATKYIPNGGSSSHNPDGYLTRIQEAENRSVVASNVSFFVSI